MRIFIDKTFVVVNRHVKQMVVVEVGGVICRQQVKSCNGRLKAADGLKADGRRLGAGGGLKATIWSEVKIHIYT